MDFSLLDSVPDAMVIADDQGTILHANGVAERLFGYARAALVGRPVELLLPARFRATHQVHRAGYHTAPRTRPMGLGLDLSGLRADGSEFAAEISLSPIDVDGRACVIAAVRDVTERKKLEDRARLWRKARDEVRERDEFLSIASHELRTPVTALQLQLQLLHRAAQRSIEELPRLLEGKMEVLERQTRRIALLVNELLDVSRMRLGKVELRYEDVDLSEIARDVVSHLGPEIGRTGSRLRLDLAPAPGRWDRVRIEQVLTNLLVNAAKFGEGKPITLAVESDATHARIRVSDRGIGISSDAQARVFERFERAVPSEHFGGLGIGLYVVRQVVDAHGGQVRVESAPGAGASFTVQLPRRPPAETSAADGAAGAHPGQGA
ncbi:MAG TPA: PAS domain-containing sensor histidine kinase [Anaeromyxobacter sp.]|nr:PAS domain-containing sensor histidine kinase [Anaeromyxobacter sp.]